MKAMILAAGLGTRLRPLTDKMPKPLIPVGGVPLLFYHLALLKKYAITDVVINLHYLGDQIKNLLGDGSRFGFSFHYSEESEILGTGGGIFHAKNLLKGSSQFLVINGDIITDIDLGAFMKSHQEKAASISLALIPGDQALVHGVLKLDAQGYVSSILGQPPEGQGQSTFFSGIHVINESVLDFSVNKEKFCIIRDVYQPLMAQGKKIAGYIHQGYWNDLGTPARLEQTQKELISLSLSFQHELEELKNTLKKK